MLCVDRAHGIGRNRFRCGTDSSNVQHGGVGCILNGKGWFVTRDGFSYTPDSLNFDERMPNLIPYLDHNKLMNISNTQHLKDLVELLCSLNSCPEVVYMNIDLTYITLYSLEVLHTNKQILNALNISFGINLVDQCVEIDNCVAEILSTDHSHVVLNLDAKSKYPNLTRNQMQELSLINVLNFLINQYIVDKDRHIAITTWITWPIEIGQQTNELRSDGMAHTANEIFEQILIPHSFAK
ncbi:unnamed protein product [Adineta steineri]|uniref:Uncharacterized protein n=1 Tax=Adineta steineri TaxID=433720 RepID=A0A813XNE2_9BILA|nr:unnamed protein product [Adineta steineri]CAF4202968.1 unnamed protein product [Adineta steineri]